MREHLKKFFTSAAAHHTQMAKLAETAMNGYDEDSDEHAMHKAAMESNIGHAQCCTECAKACAKTDGGADLEKLLMPSEISRVVPTAPHITAVPRYGSRPLPTADQNPIFAEVFGSGSDE